MESAPTPTPASHDPIVLVGHNIKYTSADLLSFDDNETHLCIQLDIAQAYVAAGALPEAEALIHGRHAYRDARAAAGIDCTARRFISRIPAYQEKQKRRQHQPSTFHDISTATGRAAAFAAALADRPPVVDFIRRLIRESHIVAEMAALDAIGRGVVVWYQRVGGVRDQEGIHFVAEAMKAWHRKRNAEMAAEEVRGLRMRQVEEREREAQRHQQLAWEREVGREEWERERKRKRLRTG